MFSKTFLPSMIGIFQKEIYKLGYSLFLSVTVYLNKAHGVLPNN